MKKFLFFNLFLAFSTSIAFAAQDDYEKLEGCAKQQVLWSRIVSTEYDALPSFTGFEPLSLVNLALPWNKQKAKEYLGVTVNLKSDFMPEGRKKLVHTYGSAATFTFVPAADTPYSGLFRGNECGIIRLSVAIKPNVITLPGAALKFLVDGVPSRNLQVMNSLTGQSNYNFFAREFSNVLPVISSPLLKPLADLFGSVTRDPFKLSLRPLASIEENGQKVEGSELSYPEKIVFVPGETLKFSSWPHEYRRDLATVSEGTVLYKVFEEKSDKTKRYLGEIRTTSRFVASGFGDKVLFFGHHRVEEE